MTKKYNVTVKWTTEYTASHVIFRLVAPPIPAEDALTIVAITEASVWFRQ